jgi:hypothetical protein
LSIIHKRVSQQERGKENPKRQLRENQRRLCIVGKCLPQNICFATKKQTVSFSYEFNYSLRYYFAAQRY